MTETIGFDIGSHSIKLVGLKMTSKGVFLTHIGIKEIPPRQDQEREGYLSEILKALLREVGIKPGKVRLTVSGSGIHIRRIVLPFMPKAELKEAVRWGIKEHLPFSVETAQIDFHILGDVIEDKVKKWDLMVVACPNHLIDETLAIAKNAGLQPAHLSVGPFALWNAFGVWGQVKESEEVALIDLGADKTGIHFFKGGNLQLYREITPAGTDITRSIIEGIGSGEETPVLYERAEKIKEMFGIPSEGSQEKITDESINVSKITSYMRPLLERMAGEIGRSLDYYRHEFSVERMDRVFLTGGGAHLKNFSSYLENAVRLPVVPFNPLKGMRFDANKIPAHRQEGMVNILNQMGSRFTVAAGVALPQPKRIDLLSAKEPVITKSRIVKSIPVLAPLIILLTFLLIIWNTNLKVAKLKQERDAKVGKVANIEVLQARLTLLKEKEQKVKQELSLFPSSLVVLVSYEEILREISRILPHNVTLTFLSVQTKETKAGPTIVEPQTEGKSQLRITGIVLGSDIYCLNALAQIIEGLEKSQLLKNAKLLSADENKLNNQQGAKFEIVSDMVLGGQIMGERH